MREDAEGVIQPSRPAVLFVHVVMTMGICRHVAFEKRHVSKHPVIAAQRGQNTSFGCATAALGASCRPGASCLGRPRTSIGEVGLI